MFWEVGVVTMVLAVALSAGDTPQGYGMDLATGALINKTDALTGFGAARGFTDDTEMSRMPEEAIDDNSENSLDKHRPCFPIISCTLAGGHCVERRKDCDGTVDRWGCRRGNKCKCCIPDQVTATPSTCPTVTPCPTFPDLTTTRELTTTTYCQSQRTTICPDDTRCHADATCVFDTNGYACKCSNGYAGDGSDCGTDTDLDSWPDVDLECCIKSSHCTADNCVNKPNSGQEDYNNNGIGDACGDPKPPPTVGPVTPSLFCTPRKPHTNCTLTSDAWMTTDTDGDGHVDSCDNCPHDSNVDQADLDGDRVGDECDTDIDTDMDGIQDGIDNCIIVYNQGQSDVDFDGLGDDCDDDADGDGILNPEDNCFLVHNPGQEDADNDGFGNVCQDDKDGDCLPDHLDICPKDPTIHSVDFNDFHIISLDENNGQPQPNFVVNEAGNEITQTLNSKPGLMFGQHTLAGLDFDGTFYIDHSDDDFAGFIFGYKASKTFYVVMWKKSDQNYWECNSSPGEAGLQLKRVHSSTGPSACLADALWANTSTTDQVSVLWKDSNRIGWDYATSYRWELIHRPHIGLIRFRFLIGAGVVIVDSGNIYDDTIKSGFLGVYCHSQAGITWSNLKYYCNDDSVPQEVYDDLPSDKKANVSVDLSKDWSGKVKNQRRKLKSHLVSEMPEEAIDFNNRDSLEKHQPCFPIISCTLAGGHCVEHRKDCDGTVDRWGCRGGNCKCCIPDKTTPTPSTCPTVTPCPIYTTPTTTGPTVQPNITWMNVSGDWFVRFPQVMNWFDAQDLCVSIGLNLYHPLDILAVAAYLEANFNTQWYWFGAKGNGTNQVWFDGEVLTSADPWYRPETYFNNGTNDCLAVITHGGWPAKGTVLFAQIDGCTIRTLSVICG